MTVFQAFYDRPIRSLELDPGICLPVSATMDDIFKITAKSPDAPFIAVKGVDQKLLGIASVGKLLGMARWFDANDKLDKIPLDCGSIIDADESITAAYEKLLTSRQNALAVRQDGFFSGFLSAKEILLNRTNGNQVDIPIPSKETTSQTSQFISYVAHDLGNPLMVISLASGYLMEKLSDRADLEKQVLMIRRATNQALQISQGLVQLERYSKFRRISLNKRSLTHFMNELLKENVELVNFRGHELVIEHCDSCEVMIDDYLIRGSLLNLIDNACKYSLGNGKIFLSASCLIRDDNEVIEFSVRDQGAGIAAEQLRKIFEPFVQLKSETNSRGFGLGLTIVKKFVEFHGGQVRAESREGEGTRFSISIPRIPDPSTSAQKA